MPNPPQYFSGHIPPEILGEFFSHLAEEDLKETSLVCSTWGSLSQQQLFARVWVDPTLKSGVCDVAREPHTHLTHFIKKVQVFGKISRRDPIPARCSPEFTEFLWSLNSPEAVDVLYPDFDWVNIPEDTLNAFLGVFSHPSFKTLEVSYGKNFPLSLFLHKTNVAMLTILDTSNFVLLPHADSPDSLETRLTSLTLLGPNTITAFAAFLSANVTFSQAFHRSLTQLTLRYVESRPLSSLSMDTTIKILSSVGSSIESLRVTPRMCRAAAGHQGEAGVLEPHPGLRADHLPGLWRASGWRSV